MARKEEEATWNNTVCHVSYQNLFRNQWNVWFSIRKKYEISHHSTKPHSKSMKLENIIVCQKIVFLNLNQS